MPAQGPPSSQQQQTQQHQSASPHHHSQPANLNSAPTHASAQQQRPHVPSVSTPPVQSPKEETPVAAKTVASVTPPTPPNYAKAVSDDRKSATAAAATATRKKEEGAALEGATAKATASPPTPTSDKKEAAKEKQASSPVEAGDKKEETGNTTPKTPTVEADVESIAKNSKLNPNAKEFTLNPAAKPFTPRNQQPQQPPQQPLHQPPPPAPAAHYANQAPNLVTQVHSLPPTHFQHQNAMVQMQTQGVPRMANQQVLLHQMVGPGGPVFPYQVVVPPYQQQVSQSRGKQGSKYQNSGRNDQYNQSSPHNVAAATGHPVLATAPIAYQQQPALTAQLLPMYQMQGFNPRMPVGMMGPQVQYDPSHMYRESLALSASRVPRR